MNGRADRVCRGPRPRAWTAIVACGLVLTACADGGGSSKPGAGAPDGGLDGTPYSSGVAEDTGGSPEADATSSALDAPGSPDVWVPPRGGADASGGDVDGAAGVADSTAQPDTVVGVDTATEEVGTVDAAGHGDAAEPSGCTPTTDGTNDATVVAHTSPTSLACGQEATATLTMHNAGTTTWSRGLGYRLGTNDDSDPLYPGGTRVELPDDVCVPPGADYTFTIPLVAPGAAGTVTTDWRMVLEGVEWFGAVASKDVDILCAAEGEDQIDLTKAVIIKGAPGVASWPITDTLTDVTVAPEELCTFHTKAGQWPTVPFFDDPESPIEGNQWLFANIDGTWYGGAGEWLRPAQECKIVNAANIGPDEFYNDNEEPLHSWVPASGELVGVMVSTPARAWPAMATLDERSNVVLIPWQ